eukprot:1193269-Prorocentrum_minimum.AAC.1
MLCLWDTNVKCMRQTNCWSGEPLYCIIIKGQTYCRYGATGDIRLAALDTFGRRRCEAGRWRGPD